MRHPRLVAMLFSLAIPGLLSTGVSAQEIEDLTSVRLDYPVHFLAPDGSDLISQPGTYRVEASDNGMRLTPRKGGDSLVIQATQAKNDVELIQQVAVGIPGGTEDRADTYSVLLLLPAGKSLEAVGTYSGIRPRGLADDLRKASNQVKQRVNQGVSAANQAALRANQEADRKAREAEAAVSQAAQRAAQEADRKAREAAMLAQQAALKAKQDAERFARILACKVTVGAIRAGRALAGMLQALPVARGTRDSVQTRIQQDPAFRDQLKRLTTDLFKPYAFAVPEMRRIAAYLNDPRNRPALESIFSPENFCQDSGAEFDKKLRQLGLIPSFAAVGTRGAEGGEDWYFGYKVTFGAAAAVLGGQVGISGVTNFHGSQGKYWFAGWQPTANVGGDLTAQASIFKKPLEEFTGGWEWGIGGALGIETGIPLGGELSFNQTFPGFPGSQFHGVSIGPDVAVGVIPVDVEASYTHSWKY